MRTLLAAIAKNEDRYIEEWTQHHLRIGFDHIVIYDNGHDPALQGNGVTCLEIKCWPSTEGIAPQVQAYNACLFEFGDAYDWIMFLDIDEFLNLKIDNNLQVFLSRFPRADAVCVNWKIFGSAGTTAYQSAQVTARFTRSSYAQFGPNAHVKSIFRPKSAKSAGVHVPELEIGKIAVDPSGRVLPQELSSLNFNIDHSIAQINHYFTKSRGEYLEKRRRGRADLADGDAGKHRSEEEFDAYDINVEEDLSIQRWWR